MITRDPTTGLSANDVAEMSCLAALTQPDLPVPSGRDIKHGPIAQLNGALGTTGILFGGVTLDNSFLGKLDGAGRELLLDTIIHESLHRRQGFLGRSFSEFRDIESPVYQETSARMTPELRDIARRGGSAACGCKK
jgi:hypothetical protein